MSSRTYSRNAYESQLAGAITSGATTITLDSTVGLTQPCYLVIEPDDGSKREYIKANGISGSQLTSVARGLDGSAAGAQAHTSGAVIRAVMVHQIVDDIFDDIEVLETADLNHIGGTDTSDHPEATGSVRGFMSAADKNKLDGIASGAVANHDLLSGVSANDHHDQQHVLSGADHTGQVSNAQVPASAVTQHQGSIDHGSIAGLADNDHPQYLQRSGAAAMTGDLNLDGNDILNPGDIPGYATDGELTAALTLRPEMLVDRVVVTSPVAVNTVATAVAQATLVIPAGWGTYDIEAIGSMVLSDTSGGATGVSATITSQMVHQSGNMETSLPWELMDLNYHDQHPFSQVSFVEGLAATGSRLFTWQLTRSADFTVSADQITFIVRAYRTS